MQTLQEFNQAIFDKYAAGLDKEDVAGELAVENRKADLITILEEADRQLMREPIGAYQHWDRVRITTELVNIYGDGEDFEPSDGDDESFEIPEPNHESEEDLEDEDEDNESGEDAFFANEENLRHIGTLADTGILAGRAESEEDDEDWDDETVETDAIEEPVDPQWYDGLIITKGKGNDLNKAKTIESMVKHLLTADVAKLTAKELASLIAPILMEKFPSAKMNVGYAKAYIDYLVNSGRLTL